MKRGCLCVLGGQEEWTCWRGWRGMGFRGGRDVAIAKSEEEEIMEVNKEMIGQLWKMGKGTNLMIRQRLQLPHSPHSLKLYTDGSLYLSEEQVASLTIDTAVPKDAAGELADRGRGSDKICQLFVQSSRGLI